MLRMWLVVYLAGSSVAIPLAVSAKLSPTPVPITSHIPRQRVESTAIAGIGYSKRRHILEIEFVNGAIYRYVDVPSVVYRDLMSADSKARLHHSACAIA